MYRYKIKELKTWKLSNKRKPLLFLGARQVGKTYLLKKFGETEYKQFAYINFEHPNAPKRLFDTDFDINRIITVLNAYCNLKINAENTLIIFDEIQTASKGLTALKYFQENAPEYHVIGAGSLLGVNIHHGESFPVGKVDFMKLHPMSFHEFLLTMDESSIAELLKKNDLESLSFFHEKLTNYLRYYLYIGGMPEAVKDFVENQDWQSVRHIQNQIISSYKSDFSKYAPKEILPRINMVWDSMPAQLAKENKKFIYGVIKEGSRARDFELAIQWLVDAGLLHKIYNISKAALPLVAYQELSAFKIFHNDVGLLGAMCRLNAKTITQADAIFTEFKGALAEQYVFQQLIQNEKLSIHYHTFDKSKYELNFIIQNENDEIIPMEVKAGKNLKSASFQLFTQKNKSKRAIRTSLSTYKKEDWLTNIPLYSINTLE